MKQKRGSMIFRFALIAIMVFVFATIFVACGKDDKNGGVYDGDTKLAMNEEFFEKFVGFVLKNTLEDNTYASAYVRYYKEASDYFPLGDRSVGGSCVVGVFSTMETICEVYSYEIAENAQIFYSKYSDRDDEELSVSIIDDNTVTITYDAEDYSAPKDVNYYQNEILTSKIPENSISDERLSFIKKSLSAIKDGYASFEYKKSNNCIEPFSDKKPETYEIFCFEELRDLSTNIRDYLFAYTNTNSDIGVYNKQELSEIATKLDTDYGEGSYVDTTRENGFIFAELYGKDRAA